MTLRLDRIGPAVLLLVLLPASVSAQSPPAEPSPEASPSPAEQAVARWRHLAEADFFEPLLEREWAVSPEARAAVFLDDYWHLSGTPSISVAVMRDGELLFSEARGFADLDHMVPAGPHTVYNIGSVSKVVATVGLMQLVEQGKVDLDAPIQTYVPAFPEKQAPLTLRHVLTHTSGIRHYVEADFREFKTRRHTGSFAEGIHIFKDDPLRFDPGAYYAYSSYAANLLEAVVEQVTGQGFEEYLRQQVWRPAGMLRTSFDRPERIVPGRARGYGQVDGRMQNYPAEDVTYKFAGGGMLSTSEDLARFGSAILAGRLLRPETVERMWQPQLDGVLVFRGDDPPRPLDFEQALMWRIDEDGSGRDYVNHCGTVKGFNSCLILYPEAGLVVAAATNSYSLGLSPLRSLAELFWEERESD